MKKDHHDMLDLKSEIINGFHPVEQLFKIMSKQSEDIPEGLVRSCAEVGLELCRSFRIKLDAILTAQRQDKENEHR